jgi:cytochrome c peroxidase
MALPDEACVVLRVQQSSYLKRYVEAFGDEINDIDLSEWEGACETPAEEPGNSFGLDALDRDAVDVEFRNIVTAIGDMFEDSKILNKFSSKYDAWRDGAATMTDEELLGMELFANDSRQGGASCNFCHGFPVSGIGPGGVNPQDAVFVGTDWEFDNIGTPENPINVHQVGPDLGLGGVVGDLATEFGFSINSAEDYNGMFRVPPLRNIALQPVDDGPKVYMHNGVFTTLEEIVHFYNTALLPAGDPNLNCDLVTYRDDVGPYMAADPGLNCWPNAAPENEPGRVPPFLVGNLGLTAEEEDAIVAFLKTLSDGWSG